MSMRKEKNAPGHLYRGDGVEMIRFPGCEKVRPLTFWAFTRPGSHDGLLIKIGGTSARLPGSRFPIITRRAHPALAGPCR